MLVLEFAVGEASLFLQLPILLVKRKEVADVVNSKRSDPKIARKIGKGVFISNSLSWLRSNWS